MIETITCPNCDAEDVRGSRFCPPCGSARAESGRARAAHAPLIRLLTEVADLQHELLKQFEKGRRVHARQFERAIAAQTDSLKRTLQHHSQHSERLQVWQKWTAGLAAAVGAL